MGTKISALPAAGTLTGAEIVPLDQGGVTSSSTTGLIGINVKTAAETAASVTPVNYRQPSDTSLVRSSRFNAAANWDYRYDQRLFELYLSKYGAVFNGTSDDGPALLDSINAIFALGGYRRVFMPSGSLTAKINSGFSLYCGAVGIDFNGLTINSSSITSGTVISGVASGTAPYSRAANALSCRNFNVIGASSGSSVLLSLTGGTPEAGEVSNGWLRDFSLYAGSIGLQLNANTYILPMYDVVITGQTSIGLYAPVGVNAGENIQIHGGQISNVISGSNTGLGISLPDTANSVGIKLFGVSLDNNDQMFSVLGGRLEFHGCYGQMLNTANPIGSINLTSPAALASVTFLGGEFAITEATTARTNIFTIAGGATTSITALGTRFAGVSTTMPTAQLVNITDSGPSVVLFEGCQSSYIQAGNAAGGILNRLYNGNFETGNLNGWTQTAPTGYTITADTSTPHTGTYACKVVSTGASASGGISQAIPVRPGQNIVGDAWLNVTALTAGSVYVYVYFYSDSGLTNQLPYVITMLGKTAATSGYVEATTNVGAPQGANYAKIVAEGTASFAGTFFVDDLKLAPI